MHDSYASTNGLRPDAFELGRLMTDGLARVQRELGNKACAVLGDNTNFDLGIAELSAFQREVGATSSIYGPEYICNLSQLDNPHSIGNQFKYPKILLVEHPLRAIAVGTRLNMDERFGLINDWTKAVSEGLGRTYPARLLARLSVAGIVDAVKYCSPSLGTDFSGQRVSPAEEIITSLDTQIPVIGPLLAKLDQIGKKAGSYILGNGWNA